MASEEEGGAGTEPMTEEERKRERKAAMVKKAVRIITVVLYLSGVFGGGTLLSLYYVIFWDPSIEVQKPPNAQYLTQGMSERGRRSIREGEGEVALQHTPLEELQRLLSSDDISNKFGNLMEARKTNEFSNQNKDNKYLGRANKASDSQYSISFTNTESAEIREKPVDTTSWKRRTGYQVLGKSKYENSRKLSKKTTDDYLKLTT